MLACYINAKLDISTPTLHSKYKTHKDIFRGADRDGLLVYFTPRKLNPKLYLNTKYKVVYYVTNSVLVLLEALESKNVAQL